MSPRSMFMVVLLVLSATFGTHPAQANLLVNGSFESGPSVGGYVMVPKGSTAITGWVVVDEPALNSIDYIGTLWQSADGNRSLDMNHDYQGAIQQSFATVVNQVYRVSFMLAASPYGGSLIKTLGVSAAGQHQYYNFDRSGHTYTDMGWTPKTFYFKAVSTTTTLRFQSIYDDSWYGPALDQVVVEQVNIPPLLLLLD